jgi:hypothetical protein
MHEKRGDITDKTPQPADPQPETDEEQEPNQPQGKEAADRLEDHPASRVSEAVADQSQN